MSLQLQPDIFRWLNSIKILKDGKRNEKNKIQLGQQLSTKFFDGLYISEICKVILKNKNQDQIVKKMLSIKQNSTPAIRLYNWNILTDVLKSLKYSLDYTQKSKILNLQSNSINKILKHLHKINTQQVQLQSNNSTPLQLDINTIQNKKSQDAKNILQFFVICISKHFKLSAHHTLNLFLDNNKYLAHLLVKGIKDSFQPILNFLQQIQKNMEFICLTLFCADQQKSIQFFVNALKPCLISKDKRIGSFVLTIYQSLHQIYSLNSLNMNNITKWIKTEGAIALLFSTKRNFDTLQRALQITFNFLNQQLFEYIRPKQNSPLWETQEEKLIFFKNFLFISANSIIQAFQQTQCLKEWGFYCFKSFRKNKNIKEMLIIIQIMQRFWTLFQNKFTKQYAQGFLSFFKSTCLSDDYLLFLQSIKSMFSLMDLLGKRKNSYAPLIYKILVNCLSFESNQDRMSFIVGNFIQAFNSIQTLPGTFIVEPLLKSIQRHCVLPSLQLCAILLREQKVKEEDASQIIEMLTKILFQNIEYGPLAIQYIFKGLKIFDDQLKFEFLVKNSKLSLSQFYSFAKIINRSFTELKNDYKRYKDQAKMKKGQQNYLSQVQKYLITNNIINFIKQAINQHKQVKQQLQASIFLTFIKIKNIRKAHFAQILLPIMRVYYDIQQELKQKIREYENQSYQQQMIHNQNQYESQMVQSGVFITRSLQKSQQSPKKIDTSIFKPQKSAIRDLQKLKKKKEQYRLMTEQNQKQNDTLQQKKDLIRSILNQKRIVQFGVKNKTNFQYKCIFQFDTVKTQPIISGLHQIDIIDLKNQEEDAYIQDVDSIMKKFRKIWRFFFFKYSTFGASQKESLRCQQKINMTEVWKMHKDYEIDLIKKQQCYTIVRIVNQNMKRRNDIQNLTYLGFEQYIIQMCYHGFKKKGFSSLTPGQKILELITHIKNSTFKKGGNIDMFQNPQEIYFQQTQVIQQFNKRLKQNPNYILPEGYKKVKQNQLKYQYQQFKSIQINIKNSYFQALSVLDQIIFAIPQLNFHIIQPQTHKQVKTIAKPALFQKLNQKMKDYKGGYLLPKRQVNSTYLRERQKISSLKPEFHPLINFSLGIKLGLAAIPIQNKFIGSQVAYWIDDMLDSVQNGSLKVQNKAKKKVSNQILRKKKMMLSKIKHQKKEIQNQFKKRSNSVKIQVEKFQQIKKQINKKKILDLKQKRKVEKEKQQKQIKKKLKEFQQAKKYFAQKHKKQKQKVIVQQQKRKKEKEQYKKGVSQYFKKKKQQLQQKEANIKQNKLFQLQKQQQQKQKKLNMQKRIHLSVIKKDQIVLDKINQLKLKYQEIWTSQNIQKEIQIHRKSLQYLFQLLLKYQKSKISATEKNQIGQNTFHFFALKFKVIPFMIQKTMLSKIFRSVARDQSNKSTMGINYRSFEQALFKIVIKSKKLLNEIVQQKKKKLNSKVRQIEGTQQIQISRLNQSMISNKSKLELNEQILAEDYLFNPDGVTQETLRQFMLFFNLPDDKYGVQSRYKQLIESKTIKPTNKLIKQLRESIEG